MQEGQVQLLLDERGVHLNLDSAGKRLEEGERKRGWRKRKEENGVQAHKRVEIILDHKGWNSRKSKDILRICQSIMEKGKEARWSRRWQSRGSGPTSSPWWWRRGSGPTSSPWWWRRPPHSLAWAERRVNDIVINFFLKNTSSPVMMEKWTTAGRSWKENTDAKMRSWREDFNNWTVLRMTFFLYP